MTDGKWWLGWLLSMVLGVGPAGAHEHWIDADDFYPAVGTTVTVTICSGHYFPRSAFALQDKVLEGVELLSTGKEPEPVLTTASDKFRTGTISLASEGVHLLRCTLKRPRAQQPSYEAKAVLIAGAGKDDPGQYAVGRGLELVPSKPVSELSIGDELPLFLVLDGARIPGALEVSVEGGRTSFLKTDPNRPAMVRLPKASRYLATAHVQGRGCSLVFRIEEPRTVKP